MNEPIRSDSAPSTPVTRFSHWYSNQLLLRAAVQRVDVYGGVLDTLLAGLGAGWEQRRVSNLVELLTRRLQQMEARLGHLPPLESSEALNDFVVTIFEQAARARSERKRAHFANLLASQMVEPREWDEAEAADRLLNELTDIHVEILQVACSTPVCTGSFGGLRMVCLNPASPEYRVNEGTHPPDLRQHWPHLDEAALRMYCAELVSRGLLKDEGIGRIGGRALEHFVATNLSAWFLEWISDISITSAPVVQPEAQR